MGLTSSTAAHHSRRQSNLTIESAKSSALMSPMEQQPNSSDDDTMITNYTSVAPDYSSELPDECLAHIFQSLNSGDRKRCSLVCRRWWRIEGQSRHRLSLKAQSDLYTWIPSIFARFDSVTKLALKCDRRSASIDDDALVLISLRCRQLTRLKLRACRQLTDVGMAAFARNCKGLKKLSFGSCAFGAKGMNAVLDNCANLEELSVKRLRDSNDGALPEAIGPGLAAGSLKSICLKDLFNGHKFGPLIVRSMNLRTLKVSRCYGDWDKLFQLIAERVSSIVEIHMEKLQLSDVGLEAISSFPGLEVFHLVKILECSNFGIVAIAERCKLLRKLHIDGMKANRIGDEGLSAVAKSCSNLQELVLIGVNPTKLSLEMLASNCNNLERLALCASDSVGDDEICCIAAKCLALKKLCIKSCPVTDQGIEALASGCPNLVKVKVKKCRGVTLEGADWLRASRGALAVNLDAGEPENLDASASDGGAQDNGVEFPPVVPETEGTNIASTSSTGRSASLKSRLSRFSRRRLVSCTFSRWSGGCSSSEST